MNDQDHRPAEPVEDDKGQPQGFAGLARGLNKTHPERPRPISRQLVHKWYLFRHHNRFPEPVGATGTGPGRPVFDPDVVEDWYIEYRRTHGGETLKKRKKQDFAVEHPETVSGVGGQIAA